MYVYGKELIESMRLTEIVNKIIEFLNAVSVKHKEVWVTIV